MSGAQSLVVAECNTAIEADVVDAVSQLIPWLTDNVLSHTVNKDTACAEPAWVDIGVTTAGKCRFWIWQILVCYTTIGYSEVVEADKTTEEVGVIDTFSLVVVVNYVDVVSRRLTLCKGTIFALKDVLRNLVR